MSTVSSISPSTTAPDTTSAGAAKNSAIDQQNQFLTLLTYQLKSQDPMKPMDNQAFASQLAQFSQLQYLSDIKGLITDQNKSNLQLSNTISNAALPGMLGKNAKAFTEHLNYTGSGNMSLGFENAGNMSAGMITVLNDSGQKVKSIPLSGANLNNGEHTFEFDGKDANGNTLPKGTYTFFADFQDATGAAAQSKTFTYGQIEAVRFKSDGTKLVIGGLEVSLADVTDITTAN